MKLQTTCEAEIWSGFFGINENGDQPECGAVIEEEVEEDCVERDEYGIRPCYSVRCPKCGILLEWPQEWEIIE